MKFEAIPGVYHPSLATFQKYMVFQMLIIHLWTQDSCYGYSFKVNSPPWSVD